MFGAGSKLSMINCDDLDTADGVGVEGGEDQHAGLGEVSLLEDLGVNEL